MKTIIHLWISFFALTGAAVASHDSEENENSYQLKQAPAFINKFFAAKERQSTDATSLYFVLVISGGAQPPMVVELGKEVLGTTDGVLKIDNSGKAFSYSLDLKYARKAEGRVLLVDGKVKYNLQLPGGHEARGNEASSIGFGGSLDSAELSHEVPLALGSHGEMDQNTGKSITLVFLVFLVWK